VGAAIKNSLQHYFPEKKEKKGKREFFKLLCLGLKRETIL
jgi:hypothetical protein